MYLFTAAQSGSLNTGDIIVQIVLFLVLISIPVAIVFLFVNFRKLNKRSKRLENKMDKLTKNSKESS